MQRQALNLHQTSRVQKKPICKKYRLHYEYFIDMKNISRLNYCKIGYNKLERFNWKKKVQNKNFSRRKCA